MHNQLSLLFCSQGKLATLLPQLGGQMSFKESLREGVPYSPVDVGGGQSIGLSPKEQPLTILQIRMGCHDRDCP